MALEDAAVAADAKDPAATAAADPAKAGAAAASPEAGKDGAAADTKGGAAAATATDGKAVDAAAEVDGDQGTSILDGEGDEGGEGEEGAEGDDKAAAGKDGKAAAKDGDKKPASLDWTAAREKTIARALKGIEQSLAKKLTAADLPKELAKRKSAMEKQLGRYASLEDALIAGFNAQEKIRTGAYKQPLPEDASDGEKAEWRKENGIPDEAKAYDIPKVAGHQWTEADAPVLDSFKEAAFKGNFTQAQLNAATTWYAGAVEAAKQQVVERQTQTDRSDTKTAREELRTQLEGDFGPSMEVMGRLLKDPDVFPDGTGELLVTARTPDGRRIINNPAIAKALIEFARSTYGEGSMVTGQVAEAMASEEKELEALMNTDISTYMNKPWKNTGKTGTERYYEIMKKKEGKRAA